MSYTTCKYAQINQDKNDGGTVFAISYLSGIVEAPDMIPLDGTHARDDEVDMGWRWIDGEWHEPEPKEDMTDTSEEEEEEEEPELRNQESAESKL